MELIQSFYRGALVRIVCVFISHIFDNGLVQQNRLAVASLRLLHRIFVCPPSDKILLSPLLEANVESYVIQYQARNAALLS